MLSRQWGDDESTNLVKQFTFTIGLDDLAILVRVNPVSPVSHLVPFTRFNLITGFRLMDPRGTTSENTNFKKEVYTIIIYI